MKTITISEDDLAEFINYLAAVAYNTVHDFMGEEIPDVNGAWEPYEALARRVQRRLIYKATEHYNALREKGSVARVSV